MSTVRVSRDAPGFTLLELVLALAVFMPALFVVGATLSNANSTIDATNRAADAAISSRRMSQRIAGLVRPAKLSTVELPATAADVANGLATNVGDWISPPDTTLRSGVRFASATGLLSMNARLSTSPRSVEFAMEPNELDDNIDNDGDGLIDEGTVTLLQNGVAVAVLRQVEECRFALDGRMLSLRLRIGRRAQDGRLYRAVVEQHFYLRNN